MSFRVVTSLVLGIVGIKLGQTMTPPFALDYSLAVQPFFMFGLVLREWKYDEPSSQKFIIGIVGWIITATIIMKVCPGQKLEISQRLYPMFPLCHFMACFAILAVSELCKFFVSIKGNHACLILSFATLVGQNSIWLYGVHHLDGMGRKFYSVSCNNVLEILLRLTFDIVLMFGVLCVRRFLINQTKKSSIA